MKITDSGTLLQHMTSGAQFTLKNNQLHTLEGAAKNWNKILNHFRSSQTMAARETKVLTAMTKMLRPQSTEGPDNLASPQLGLRPRRAAMLRNLHRMSIRLGTLPRSDTTARPSPGETLQQARLNLMSALLDNALQRHNVAAAAGSGPADPDAIYCDMASIPAASLYDTPRNIPAEPEGVYTSMADMYDTSRSVLTDLESSSMSSIYATPTGSISSDEEEIYATPRSSLAGPEGPYDNMSTSTSSVYATPAGSMSSVEEEIVEEEIYATPRSVLAEPEALYDTPRSTPASAPAAPPPPPPRLTKKHSTEELQVLHAALSATLCNPAVINGASLSAFQRMAESAAEQGIRDLESGALSGLVGNFIRDTPALIERQTLLGQKMQTAMDQVLQHDMLFTTDNIATSTQNSFYREHPEINGARLTASASNPAEQERINSEYAQMLDEFCVSTAEKRILSFLMGPDGRLPLDSVLSDTEMPPGTLPLNPHATTFARFSLGRTDQTPPEGFCSLSRNGVGATVMEFTIPLAPSGNLLNLTLEDGRRIEVEVNERVPMAHLQYTIIVPRIEPPAEAAGADTAPVLPPNIPLTLLGMRLESHTAPSFISRELAPAS